MSASSLSEMAERLARELPERPEAPEAADACEALVERAVELAEAVARAPEPPDPALLVLGRLAACLVSQARGRAARRVLTAALGAADENAPRDGFLRAILHDQMAEALQDEGRTDEALDHAGLAEAAGREACRAGDPRLVALLNNVGTAHKRAGDLLTAEVHFRRALDMAERAGGLPPPLASTVALNLADALRSQGKYEEALPFAERGLREAEEAHGPVAFETADAAADLAALLSDLGDAAGAARHLRRAAALYERALGPGHELTRAARERLEEIEGS